MSGQQGGNAPLSPEARLLAVGGIPPQPSSIPRSDPKFLGRQS